MIKEAYFGRNPGALDDHTVENLGNGTTRKQVKLDSTNFHLLKDVFVDRKR